ncbi:MAG TPA: adenylate/guanylate cyclase domain-containing protein [Pirellulales bacterium]|jgi:adenylate cyclase
MTIRFRKALLLLMGGVTLLSLGTVGIFWHINSHDAARKLADQVLDRLAIGIEEQIEKLLGDADTDCRMTEELLRTGQLKIDEFSKLAQYWWAVLRVDPDVTSFYLAQEATGETLGVTRLRGDPISVWQTVRNYEKDVLELREYAAADYPHRPLYEESPGPDLRQRPWYLKARNQERGFWTDTYVFLGLKDIPNILGVSFTLPLRSAVGKLEGVLTADFDLSALSRFLRHLPVGDTGSAFLLEWQGDGQLYVVAHPQADRLLVDDEVEKGTKKLALAEQFADPRVQAFVKMLPKVQAGQSFPESGNMEFTVNGERYLGRYLQILDPEQPPWLICTYLNEGEILANAHQAFRMTTIVTLAVIGLAVLISLLLSRQVAQPLEQLAKEVIAAGQLRLEADPKIQSVVQEVNELATATEEMKKGLRSFQKYVPADLVRTLLDSGQEAELGGRREEVSVLFSDIVGFTSTSETTDPETLVKHLGDYLGVLSDEILKLNGTVDKFIGDSVMAFWEAGKANGGNATAACAAAVRCQARLKELRPQWLANGLPPLETRIGVHTGEVIVGNIGSGRRMNFTIIGDAVNLGSRLEGLNKVYRTEIIISESTYQQAKREIVARPLDCVSVKGRNTPVLVYELLGMRGETAPSVAQFVEQYGEALAHYRERRWADCRGELDEILQTHAGDGPAQLLMRRCHEYLCNPPPENWDGVHHMSEK